MFLWLRRGEQNLPRPIHVYTKVSQRGLKAEKVKRGDWEFMERITEYGYHIRYQVIATLVSSTRRFYICN